MIPQKYFAKTAGNFYNLKSLDPSQQKPTAEFPGIFTMAGQKIIAIALGGLMVLTFLAAPSAADDWPSYKADAAKSSVSREKLAFPLKQIWVYEPSQPPRPAWPQPGRELHRNDFDYAFQPVVAGGIVYFGSSADDTVRAIDAATGQLKWRFTTGGPVRFAPEIAGGKCYTASDDGWLYCLDALNGNFIWKFRAAPNDRRIIGNGRSISRWPCRSGVLVDDGVAYVTAGMWPSEGIYVYALDAQTGQILWCNDTSGSMYQSLPHGGSWAITGVCPQGYLLASKETLLVPTGRSVPAAYDRRTGRLLYYHQGDNKFNGGSWATIAGLHFLNPAHGWSPDLHVDFGESAPRTGDGMAVYDLVTGKLAGTLPNRHRVLAGANVLYGVGGGTLQARGKVKWTTDCPHPYSIALARDSVLIGSADAITAFAAADGSQLWREQVQGQVRGIAIADGRIIAATDKGTLYCFEPADDSTRNLAVSARPSSNAASTNTGQDIVKFAQQSNITKGYALVIGSSDARIAEALAVNTRLHVIAVLSDESVVAAERERLITDTKLYGTRIAVHQLDSLASLPFASSFANLVVVSGKTQGLSGKELYRVLRPCGGVMYFDRMERQAALSIPEQANLPHSQIQMRGAFVTFVRGKLDGAFDWDSKATGDRLVRWPLELLWFGAPGPARMVNRSWGAPSPLPANGRYFVVGEHHLIAVDAYNGAELWSREIGRLSWSNPSITADDDSVYLNFTNIAFELGAHSGNLKKTFGRPKTSKRFSLTEPQSFDFRLDKSHSATVTLRKTPDGLKVTLVTRDPDVTSQDSWELFFDFRVPNQRFGLYGPGTFQLIVEAKTGISKPGAGPSHPPVTATGGRTSDGTQIVLQLSWKEIEKLTGSTPEGFAFATTLNSYTGARPDRFPVKLLKTHKFADANSPAVNNGWATFVLDDSAPAPHIVTAELDELPVVARQKRRQPQRSEEYSELKRRSHPLTGQETPTLYQRAYGCGRWISAEAMDFFRSGTLGFYDLKDDSGLRNFGGIRPACNTNMIPALGLLLFSQGSAPCSCSYNFQTSFSLAPAQLRRNEDWAVFFRTQADAPIRQAALNFGAPGDRRDKNGLLWLGLPRPSAQLSMTVPCKLSFQDGFDAYRINADRTTIKGTDRPWIYASGLRSLRQAVLDVSSGRLRSATLRKLPKIDARLDDACWDGTFPLPADQENASVFIRHDQDNLYVAYERPANIDRRGRTKPWIKTTTGKDPPVWDDDSFELYLSNPNRTAYLHLGVAASGARYDAIWPPRTVNSDMPPSDATETAGKEDSSWNATWSSAAQAGENAFIVELAIPWKTIAASGLDKNHLTVRADYHGEMPKTPADSVDVAPVVLGTRGAYDPFWYFSPLDLDAKIPPRPYTVRLHFAELEEFEPGQRVFDVKLQGKLVLSNFDITDQAGGIRKAIAKEFKGIRTSDKLTLELIPRPGPGTKKTAPIISAIEIYEE